MDVVFVSKTWLNRSVQDSVVLPVGYNIFRADRDDDWHGGGVLIATREVSFINSARVDFNSTSNIDLVAVECTLPSYAKWIFICGYRPPDNNNIQDFILFTGNLLSKCDQVVVAGDFNFPHITWTDSACSGSGYLENLFCDTLDNYFMSQVCLLPTRQNNILDLVITTEPDLVNIHEFVNPRLNMSTDHRIICFNVRIPFNKLPELKRKVYDYTKTDFSGLKGAL